MEKPYVPHSFLSFSFVIPKERVTLPSDLLTNFIFTMSPSGLIGGGSSHGSFAEVSGKVAAGTRVGYGVKTGGGVNAIVGVGGIGVCVAVGIAACVWVIATQALATAVLCTSAADKVGTGVGPQAEIIVISSIERMIRYFLFIFFSVTYFYHIGQKGVKIFTAKISAMLFKAMMNQSCHKYNFYFFQFNMINPARQTKIPTIFTHEILSLKKKIAMGSKISEATTLTSTAAMPRFQPER